MPPYIGIHFGTSNSTVASFAWGRPEVVPSFGGERQTANVVGLRRDGTLAFGQEAKENFDEQRSIRSIQRLLGTPEPLPPGMHLRTEQIAVILFSLLKKDAERYCDEPVSRAVVTIPASSKGLARHATKLCAGASGLQVLTLINEPTAAAICYGLNAQDDQTVLVYDFGGGTLDVTILRIHHGIFEEISSKGIGKLGGDDVDAALAKVIGDRFQQKTGYDIMNSPYKQQFMLACERAKIELSAESTATVRVDLGSCLLEEEVGREEFERIVLPLAVESGRAIDEALKLRGLRPRDIDKILLVGGSSKIPLVRRFVCEKLEGKEPEPGDGVDPATCTAEGAAIVSAILQGAPGADRYPYLPRLERSLCVPRRDARTGRDYLDPILKRGADIPCCFTLTVPGEGAPVARTVVRVYEGDVYDDPESPENLLLAEIPWDFEPPRPQRDAALDVTFEYGDDGVLTLEIFDPLAAFKKRIAVEQEPLAAPATSRLFGFPPPVATPEQGLRDARAVLQRTEQAVLPAIEDAADRQEIEELCQAVRQAIEAGDSRTLEDASMRLCDRLLDYAYLL